MAAPAGYRTWSTADLVSAADFSTYIQDQVVGVYTSSSNRSSELSSPSEGQVSFLTDTNVISVYISSAWVDIIDVDTFTVSSGNYAMTGTLTMNSGSDTFSLPTTRGSSTNVLQSDGDGTTSWVAATSGDVTGVTAGTLIDVTDPTGPVPTINVDLSEAATSTSDGDGDYFIVTDAASAQHKLTKGNIALSGFNNDSGFGVGDITGITTAAASGLSGGATSGTPVLVLNLAGLTAAQNFGSDGSGVDVTMHSATAGDALVWSAANESLTITGTDGQTALDVPDGNVTITDTLTVSGGLVAPLAINAQTGTTYTFVLADAGKLVTSSNGSAQTVTVPPNSSVAFAIGTQIIVQNIGSANATLATAGTPTLNSKDANLEIDGQFAAATLIKTATDAWSLIGALA